ncbi:hexitol phosphatase HxpB [Pseudoflavitalea sp. G-6-1-2]|uniref:hexitol phosphatase HxpB n=1 Tax=Pseudoflavitalea sp. G-6-1-2 TaxID=2728841 RepID=UPI00146B51A7|nr:hexitol phosphatase HxpB [Pseudoflavitalea sp. G-6-1-2]NML23091.1 hexitol phosphatase HxpB [Pseudoflavitalea sp. G-6-1-2]
MNATAVIFDMDGLLINSEPYWEEAGKETLEEYGVSLIPEQYHVTTGLRTKEWVQYWFAYFGIDMKFTEKAEATIVEKAISKIREKGLPMPGVEYIFEFFRNQGCKIGIATSSPLSLVNVVVEKLNIRHYLDAIASAEFLPYGKPHPQVYLDCAKELGVSPLQCICFEDSFNGMIAVKAARMKCIVIPAPDQHAETRWDAADIKLRSLEQVTASMIEAL